MASAAKSQSLCHCCQSQISHAGLQVTIDLYFVLVVVLLLLFFIHPQGQPCASNCPDTNIWYLPGTAFDGTFDGASFSWDKTFHTCLGLPKFLGV